AAGSPRSRRTTRRSSSTRSRSRKRTASRRSGSSSRCCTASAPASSSTSSAAASTSSSRRPTGPSGTATSCEGSPNARPISSPCCGISWEIELDEQNGGEPDQREVAGEEVPRPRRCVVGRERPVVGREPRLRQAECEEQQASREDPSPAANQEDERDEPDEVLRRKHLVEGDQGGHGGGGRGEHPFSAGIAA